MKEFVAFVLLLVLIGIGWNQSYSSHFYSVAGKGPLPGTRDGLGPVVNPLPTGPAATPEPRDNAWLWHKTSMDEPYKDKGSKGSRGYGR